MCEKPTLTESTEMLDITVMDVTPSVGPETAGTQTMHVRTMMDIRTISPHTMQQICSIVSRPGIGTLSKENVGIYSIVHTFLNRLTIICGHIDFKPSNV